MSPERAVGGLHVKASASVSSIPAASTHPNPPQIPAEGQPSGECSTASASPKLAPSLLSPPSFPLFTPPHSVSEVACPPHLSHRCKQLASSDFVSTTLSLAPNQGTTSVQVRAELVQTRGSHHSSDGSRASFWR